VIRMSKLTDYGIVLMTCVARSTRLQTARQLSEQTHLPRPTVGKLLKRLCRAGMLTSQRGVHGGYELGHPAQDISIAALIIALEGPIKLTECSVQTGGGCDHEASCPCRTPWQRINTAVTHALDGISLADMSASPFAVRPGVVVVADR
jgi:FeS assembly SUF system regulator